MDASERDAALRAEVRRYVQEHLDRLPVVVAARVGRITELFRPRQNIAFEVALHERERWVAGPALELLRLRRSGIAGAVMLRRRHVPVFPLGALPVVVAATVALIFAQTRNRAPAEAAFVVLAAAALDHLRPRPPKRTTQAESLPMGA